LTTRGFGSAERLFGATLRVVVAFVGFDEPFELLGDQAADRGAALGGDDLGAVDHVVVELDGEVALGHRMFSAVYVFYSLPRGEP
jgi:hypothetical protein